MKILILSGINTEGRKKEPLMPNKFKYKGVVIIISNDTRDAFKKKEVGVETGMLL